MAMGMTYDEYWTGDPFRLIAYREYNSIKQQQADEVAWLNGLYTLKALQSGLSALFAKNESDVPKYPEKPYSVQKMEDDRISEAERERLEMLQARAYMQAFVAMGKNFGQ